MRHLILVAFALLLAGTAQAAPTLGLPDVPALPPLFDVPEVPPVEPLDPADDPLSQLALDVPTVPPLDEGRGLRNPFADGLPPVDAPKVAVAAGGVALALVGFALYSRLARSELLDNERRDGVHKLIQQTPGIALSEVAHRTGLGWGTTVYHLDRLERAGFVTSETHAGRRCYFPVGTVPREARPMLGALQQETTRSVAELVASRPGLTQTELCEGLGLSASAASKQVSKLELAGLVRREREWKTVKLHPAPALGAMLAGGAQASATA